MASAAPPDVGTFDLVPTHVVPAAVRVAPPVAATHLLAAEVHELLGGEEMPTPAYWLAATAEMTERVAVEHDLPLWNRLMVGAAVRTGTPVRGMFRPGFSIWARASAGVAPRGRRAAARAAQRGRDTAGWLVQEEDNELQGWRRPSLRAQQEVGMGAFTKLPACTADQAKERELNCGRAVVWLFYGDVWGSDESEEGAPETGLFSSGEQPGAAAAAAPAGKKRTQRTRYTVAFGTAFKKLTLIELEEGITQRVPTEEELLAFAMDQKVTYDEVLSYAKGHIPVKKRRGAGCRSRARRARAQARLLGTRRLSLGIAPTGRSRSSSRTTARAGARSSTLRCSTASR